jgi:hypothetical protein
MSYLHMVPWLITKMAAYKEYLSKHNMIKINGQSVPLAFSFLMRDNFPIYQYKHSTNDS